MRGPFFWHLTWDNYPNPPVWGENNIPVGAMVKHVQLALGGDSPIPELARAVWTIVLIYDADTQAPRAKREYAALKCGMTMRDDFLMPPTAIGGFIHPEDGSYWLVYEKDYARRA